MKLNKIVPQQLLKLLLVAVVYNVIIKIVLRYLAACYIFMAVIVYISLGLACLYAILMLLYLWGWAQQREFTAEDNFLPSTPIAVIVPARNEEANIATCIDALLQQEYPEELLEVVVVDDHSTDNTADIVKSFSGKGVKYISLAEHINTHNGIVAYKKLALTTGIAASRGALIVTTDADCTAGKDWLKSIAAVYEQHQPVMVVAPVNFTDNGSVVEVFQSLDFMSMQGITAATLQLKLGNMCNGANLAFSRAAYGQVGGYKGIDHIASGDDYLLMTKLAKEYPGRIAYLKSGQAIVNTTPQPDWKSFYRQRVRWASKSGKYGDHKLTAVLMLVYLFNLSFLAMIIIACVSPGYWMHILVMLGIKTVFEIIYLLPVSAFFKKRKQLLVFPFLQPLHIAYIIIAGLLGFAGGYQWKDRSVK